MKFIFPLILTFLFAQTAFAQKVFTKVDRVDSPVQSFPSANTFFNTPMRRFQSIPWAELQQPAVSLGSPIKVIGFSPQGRPTWVKGSLSLDKRVNIHDQAYLYLEELKGRMGIYNPLEEFVISKEETDRFGKTHIRMDQYYHGIRVQNSEVILHAKEGTIISFNGNYFPSPKVKTNPTFVQANAEEVVQSDLNMQVTTWNREGILAQVMPAHQIETSLVIYFESGEAKPSLAWVVKIHPNITEQWIYLVDAHTGTILNKHINSCKFAHDEAIKLAIQKTNIEKKSPVVLESSKLAQKSTQYDPLDGSLDASGVDLNGILRQLKTYQVTSENTNFLIDVTRPMFQSGSSNLPDEPVGAIFTINGNNGSPQGQNFQVTQLTNASTNWTDQIAVSAHYNSGLAYEYYKNTFGRNSINGTGGTVYSIINVADENGQSMDNAFWNGSAMFYGNGDQAFKPLAGALDVAGHEISHGVIQNTANLKYQGESGALNESFADIFGAMIDRDDWKMGEDVVTNVFPSGALRDLQNPHNGGNQLGDNGWQPAHVNEQYHGSQDNGGVHINSGITNKAYYLLATAINKNKAEQIYYKALKDYLTASSQFKDLRIALLSAAEDIHGAGSNEATQVGIALDAVGITGPSTGGGGGGNPGGEYQNDLQPNPGTDYIVFVKSNGKLGLANGAGATFDFESSNVTISQPSVTDDGSAIYYVADDKVIRKISFDWAGSTFSDNVLSISSNSNNANVAVSPDGSKIAAVETESNIIYIYSFGNSSWKGFELYNPTNTNGVTTDNVKQADVLYFDYSGEYVMYDALSQIKNSQGQDIEFWDVGFVHVWENNTWADGFVSKLFTGLPENTSVGNPTFAKNSPYIIAFDYQDSDGNHTLRGSNIETGKSAVIANNDTWSRPSFAPNDQFLLADTKDQSGTYTDLVKVPLAASKYEWLDGGQSESLISSAGWGNWFANGTRSLVIANEEVLNDGKVTIAPNPFRATLSIMGNDGLFIQQVDIYDIQGRLVKSRKDKSTHVMVDLSNQSQGLYFVKVIDEDGAVRLFKAIKQ